MALDTYTNLQAAVLDWLMRPGDTLVAPAIPDMIALFEEEARDRLKSRFNETTTTLAVTGGNPLVALPADFESAREIVLLGDPNQVLTEMEPEEMDAMDPDQDGDQSLFYAIIGTKLRLEPPPDANGTLSLIYMQGVPALATAEGGTNWLLAEYPSAYLYGTLAEAGDYLDDDARLQKAIRRRDGALERILAADRKARWSGSKLTIRTDTGNP
jgi:hypothetical protein